MRALIKLSLMLVLLCALALSALAVLALDNVPLVTEQAALSHADIARAKAILEQNDPRRLRPGAQRVIEVGAQDLNLAVNYLLQRAAGGHARLALSADRLDLSLTLRVPHLPVRSYLNLEGSIRSHAGHPEVGDLQVGRLTLPGPVVAWVGRRLLAAGLGEARLASATQVVEHLQLAPDRLRLGYRWDPALIAQARDTLLTSTDREALSFYHDRLAELQAQGVGRSGPLVDLLQPLFSMALARSSERDPVEENVALLTVLGTWAGGQDVSRLVPAGSARPRPFRLKIAGRMDFAQHFLGSAALAARGDSALSDAVGLFKEISDTDRGSGFSFTDIAADRAGTRFGELATRSPQDARRVQQRLAAGIAESDIMPPAGDLPEHMGSETFRQRFEHVGSPVYRQLMAEIEQRIDACGLYRDLE